MIDKEWMKMMHRNLYKILSWLMVILWMGLIFYLSHQPATESDQLSGGVVDLVIQTFERVLPLIHLDWPGFHHIVRKSAHLIAYLILGILVLHALRQVKLLSWHSVIGALIICVCYAISDEIHQLFIPGRSGEVKDVLIDSVGAIIGVGLYEGLRILIHKIRLR